MKVSLVMLLCVAFVSDAYAISLEEAKRSGLVGEKRSGYIAVVKGSDSSVRNLVDEVNKKRRDAYNEIAQKSGSPLSVVEQVGAKEAFQKSPAGTPVEAADGSWVAKK